MAKRRVIISIILLGVTFLGALIVRNGTSANSSETHYLPAVFSYSPPLQISNFGYIGSRFGTTIVQGEVINVSPTPIYNAILLFRAYNSQNQIIGQWSITTILTATFSGESNPFQFDVGNGWQIALLTGEITGWSVSGNKMLAAATVVNVLVEVDATNAYVTAVLRNDNPTPLKDVLATAWKTNYQSVPIRRDLITTSLLPGQVVTYTTTILFAGGPVPPPVSVAAQGEVVP